MSLDMHGAGAPSQWVRRFLPLARAGGAGLDLACGAGRHARLMAAAGLQVDAVDRDAELLAQLAGVAGVSACCADLEAGPWVYPGRMYDAIVVTNYLFRPLQMILAHSLNPGGVLIYETFMLGNERFGKPAREEFLLRPGELLAVFGKSLAVVAFEQGEVEVPKPAMVQRICAVRAQPGVVRLPGWPPPGA